MTAQPVHDDAQDAATAALLGVEALERSGFPDGDERIDAWDEIVRRHGPGGGSGPAAP